MTNWILFVISLVWIGIGAWASIYSSESKTTRLLGIITLILGMQVLSYSLQIQRVLDLVWRNFFITCRRPSVLLQSIFSF